MSSSKQGFPKSLGHDFRVLPNFNAPENKILALGWRLEATV